MLAASYLGGLKDLIAVIGELSLPLQLLWQARRSGKKRRLHRICWGPEWPAAGAVLAMHCETHAFDGDNLPRMWLTVAADIFNKAHPVALARATVIVAT
jgi:hypothetical protein